MTTEKTAPNEPVVKAQGFEGLDYNQETLEIKHNGKVIGKWNNEAIHDYPEDLTWDRDIGSFAAEMFQAGQKSIRGQVKLPEKNIFINKWSEIVNDWNGGERKPLELFYNWLTDAVKSLNEGDGDGT